MVRRLHDPQFVLLRCLPCHFEAVVVRGEKVGVGNEVVGLRVTPSLLIEVLPHIVLAAQIPAAGKMVEFLEFIHVFDGFEMSAADIEVDDPVTAIFALLNAVELECVNDAFVL